MSQLWEEDRSMTTHCEHLFQTPWEPISDLPEWQWVRDNVELGSDSELKRFDFDLVPMSKFFFDACQNSSVRKVTEMVSAQSGKTVGVLGHVVWKIKNNPSDAIWYKDTNVNAKTDYKTKFLPWFDSCEAIRDLMPKKMGTRAATLIQFDSMNLHILGAETQRNREGKTAFEVYCDEARKYKPGALAQIDNRFKTIRNFKRIVFSTAGEENDQLHLAWKEGTCHFFFWTCPHCQHEQTFRFGRGATVLYPEEIKCGGFVWDTNEITKPGGEFYNFTELAKTVRYECENEKCRHHFKNEDKLSLIRTLKPKQTNPVASPDNVSLHYWEAYMPWAECDWDKIVIKFLRAKMELKLKGNYEPLKMIVQETFGEPWRMPSGEKIEKGELELRQGKYSVGEEWPPEKECAKVLVADVQHGFLVFNYSLFDQVGGKRTVETGKLLDFQELRLYQQAKKIHDAMVGIDCAHEPAKVLEACAQFGRWMQDPKKGGTDHIWLGWMPMLGDEKEEFIVGDIRTYTKTVNIDANIGKGASRFIHRLSWSNPYYKKQVFLTRVKGLGQLWEIPCNMPEDYFKQMRAVVRLPILDAQGQVTGHEWKERGRHDHADNEQQSLALADFRGIGKQ